MANKPLKTLYFGGQDVYYLAPDFNNIVNLPFDENKKLEIANMPDHTHSVEDIPNATVIFIGTREQYNTANANGKVPVGSLVIITDGVSDSGLTNAMLGYAILDQMILG